MRAAKVPLRKEEVMSGSETRGLLTKGMEKIVNWTGIVFFGVIALVALAQIISRYCFNSPLFWSEELIRLMYVWICYLGWVMATRNKTHIRITTFIDMLPRGGKIFMAIFNCAMVILFSFFMIWYGISMIKIGLKSRAVTLPISFALVYAIVPVANLCILVYKVMELIDIVKNPAIGADESSISGLNKELPL
jgi:TRAP-type C4-dicarboxylate transport system permease small subunit